MTPAPRPRGAPARPPWQHAVSLRADLPNDRAAWLALVLPAIDDATTHAGAAAVLGVDGVTAGRWYAWCAAEIAAGRLPEHPGPLPPRTKTGHGQPLPSPERAAEGRAKAAAAAAAERANPDRWKATVAIARYRDHNGRLWRSKLRALWERDGATGDLLLARDVIGPDALDDPRWGRIRGGAKSAAKR